jgi:hypothetical protein
MPSIRETLNCIGRDTSGSNSVLRDLFGFARSRVPFIGSTTSAVSVKDTLDGLQGRHIHINVINVGWVNEFSSTNADTGRRKVDYAIMRTRQIYQQVNLGVGRVQHWVIDQSEADGYDNIGSEGEADELSGDSGTPNNGIDCFVPRTISDNDFIGRSPVGGDCDKGGKRDGLIAGAIDRGGSVNTSFDGFARTFAHEIGHYLSLPHNHGDGSCPSGSAANNLMAQTRCITVSPRDAVNLTSSQGSDMRGHCMTRAGC